jgi:hypothetical protein
MPERTQLPNGVLLFDFILHGPGIKGGFISKAGVPAKFKFLGKECEESFKIELRPISTIVDECFFDVG